MTWGERAGPGCLSLLLLLLLKLRVGAYSTTVERKKEIINSYTESSEHTNLSLFLCVTGQKAGNEAVR
jgi:hypothetical protein